MMDMNSVTSAAVLPNGSPEMLAPVLSSMSSSIFLLRDLILANQLPHFQASDEVRQSLQDAAADFKPDALAVLLEAQGELQPAFQKAPPGSGPEAVNLTQQHNQALPSKTLPIVSRAPKEVRCRGRVTVRCEDSWRDTFYNALQHLSSIVIADGHNIYAKQGEEVTEDGASVVSFDENDYYSSHWDTSDAESSISGHDFPVSLTRAQNQPITTNGSRPSSSARSASYGAPWNGDYGSAEVKAVPGLANTIYQQKAVDSDYTPPSVESDLEIPFRQSQVASAMPDPHGYHISKYHDATGGSKARDRYHGDDDGSTTQHRRAHPQDRHISAGASMEERHRPSKQSVTASESFERPSKKRRRNERDRLERRDRRSISQGQRDGQRQRQRDSSMSLTSSAVVPNAPQSITLPSVQVPPPPDLAAIQAYTSYQAQMNQQQQLVPQPLQVSGLGAGHFAVPQLQHSQAMTVAPPMSAMNQQMQVVNAAPPGYMLVRDQFGNAWYARPLQQPINMPVYSMGQLPHT